MEENKMEFEKWLEKNLSKGMPDCIIAFNFNLYESNTDNQYDVQLIGCKEYDLEDDDWACNEDFSTGEDLFSFFANGWEEALDVFTDMVKEYLHSCKQSNQLTEAEYITAGFVDGDLQIIFQK